LLDFVGTEKIPSYFFPIYPATIHRTSCKNQKLLLGLVVGRQEIVFIYSVSCSQEVYNTKSCLKGIGWWEVGETIHSLAVHHSIINSFGISLKIAKSQKPKN
jgi:hypothetical protein